MDRRAVFFVIAAVASLALTPVAQAQFRYIGFGLAVCYIVMAALSALDAAVRSRRR